MRIHEIRIDRFGIWRNLSLSLQSPGLSVFYGPNEAGKSTLLRFIRGLLYGYEPRLLKLHSAESQPITCEGRLHVSHRDRHCELQRVQRGGAEGELSISGWNDDEASAGTLEELLSGVDKPIFDRVFAVGLTELQELGTLHAEEVADRIYGLSLGHDGRRLLNAYTKLEAERRRLLNVEDGSGRLPQLWSRADDVTHRFHSAAHLRKRHSELTTEQSRLLAQINDLKSRQRGMQSQLRGHAFMEKVWSPWNELHTIDEELKQLPSVGGFPEGGRERLAELTMDLAAADKCRGDLLAEASAFRNQAYAIQCDRELRRCTGTIRSLIDQRDWLVQTGREIKQHETLAAEKHQQLTAKLSELGALWSPERLEQIDVSPAAHLRLVCAARTYEAAQRRRGKLRRRIKQLSAATHRKTAELKDATRDLGDVTVPQAIAAARSQLNSVEEWGRLRLRRRELEQRRIGIQDQLLRLRAGENLPKWVYGVLLFLAICGMFFIILGCFTGWTTDWLGGLGFAVLGLTFGCFAWGLKRHVEGQQFDQLEQLEEDARTNDARLRETELALKRITAAVAHRPPITTGEPLPETQSPRPLPVAHVITDSGVNFPNDAHGSQVAESEADLIRRTAHRLAQLEQFLEDHNRIQRARKRLTEMRRRYRIVQREHSAAREGWCRLLTELGLSETVHIGEAFDTLQHVVEAHDHRRAWSLEKEELRRRRDSLHQFRQRLEVVGRRIGAAELNYARPLEVLSQWESEVNALHEQRVERRRLLREAKRRRREAADYRNRCDELKLERAALLVQGGATSEDEFDRRAEAVMRRRELEELRAVAAEELAAIAATEPELAVVEEDLLAYDAAHNAECIRALRAELDDVERDLQELHERLGACKQELAAIEKDRLPTQLRFEREVVSQELRRAGEDWLAVQTAAEVLDRVRVRYERTCQPATLAKASRIMERLTRGRYRNIWTPLGQRRLCLDDDAGDTFHVEQLSRGTREQLFLAIRLAMIEELAEQGVELPMVLDDILVNFDQSRTEAAVDTLLDCAGRGQQILLFTCHLHLAHMFEGRGVEPIWLPEQHRVLEERRAG